MGQLSTTIKNKLAKHIFLNEAIAGIGDFSGIQPSSADGKFYLRLCTDDVEVDDDTLGTECTFTGYPSGGIELSRGSSGDFEVNDNIASNIDDIELTVDSGFAGTETVKYAELWMNNSGNTEAERISHCELSSEIELQANDIFRISAGNLKFPID